MKTSEIAYEIVKFALDLDWDEQAEKVSVHTIPDLNIIFKVQRRLDQQGLSNVFTLTYLYGDSSTDIVGYIDIDEPNSAFSTILIDIDLSINVLSDTVMQLHHNTADGTISSEFTYPLTPDSVFNMKVLNDIPYSTEELNAMLDLHNLHKNKTFILFLY